MKFKIDYTWSAKMRGGGSMTIEAETEDEAEEVARETAPIDYNKYRKMLDSGFDIIDIEVINE